MASRDVRAHFADLTSRLAAGDTGDLSSFLEGNERELCKRYPSLSAWPADAQLAGHLMAWLLGPGFHLSAFRQEASKLRPDFWICSESCEIPHRDRPAIVSLNFWNGRLFRNAAIVDKLGMNTSRVYFPAELKELVGV
jgi:hypothetical protein